MDDDEEEFVKSLNPFGKLWTFPPRFQAKSDAEKPFCPALPPAICGGRGHIWNQAENGRAPQDRHDEPTADGTFCLFSALAMNPLFDFRVQLNGITGWIVLLPQGFHPRTASTRAGRPENTIPSRQDMEALKPAQEQCADIAGSGIMRASPNRKPRANARQAVFPLE